MKLKRLRGFSIVLSCFLSLCWNTKAFAYDEESILISELEKKNEDSFSDFSAPPKTNYSLTENLSFGGRIDLEYVREDNFDLDTGRSRDQEAYEPSISIAMSYEPSSTMQAFLNFEPSYTSINDDRRPTTNQDQFELHEAYLKFKKYDEKIDLLFGRQRFVDKRQWILDEYLDAVRLFYYFPETVLDFSVSKLNHIDLFGDDNGENKINYMMSSHFRQIEDVDINFYAFFQDDLTESGHDPIFNGLQITGERGKQFKYASSMAYVHGQDSQNEISAFGGDVVFTYEFDVLFKPSFTVGFAYGSGDGDSSNGTDNNFRQTGFQDNDVKLSGVSSLKLYGELMDPELSNLSIYIAAFGIRPTKRSSIELIYHHYQQNQASTTLRDTELDEDPDGVHENLGDEIDVVAGFKLTSHMKLTLVAGYFMPSDAFPSDADAALYTQCKLRYTF